jgi:putative transcriptional regulator
MVKKRSKILDAVHEAAKGLHAAGAIDQMTMREFDQACLSPVPSLRPAEIKRIREGACQSGGFRRSCMKKGRSRAIRLTQT